MALSAVRPAPPRPPRYRLEVPIVLWVGTDKLPLTTKDISFNGLFIRTDKPPPLRGLVRFSVPIEGGEALAMTGMVTHVIAPQDGAGRAAGIGIQFYGIDTALRRRWSEYVNRLRSLHPDSQQCAVPISIKGVEHEANPARGRHERFSAVLDVRCKSVDELTNMCTRDISNGGAFLATDIAANVGDSLFIQLVHPQTEEVFGLSCVVRRRVVAGLGVEFNGLDRVQRRALWEFVKPVIELSDDDFELLEEVAPARAS